MLTDKQSLIICGLMTGGFFIGGILDILDNFLILTILTIAFLAIIVNLITAKSFAKNNKEGANNNSK